jgi:eukaryotic-like serine/threonine-protein kinase
MDPERWKQVDELLQSVLALPSNERDEVLHRACAGNDEVEREVRSLLRAHDKIGGFLETPAIDVAARAMVRSDSAERRNSIVGQTVSHYRVLQVLGSGGMGVVYQAEDIRLGRQVALKFLPGEVALDREAFDRLQREARAASALDHPNICSIYELDEHAGRPFIVMQLLDGQTLRAWIDGGSKKDLTSRLGTTLSLAIQMADALDAAHQKGIIHRDIKPANVFITARGRAKILDFGLAKVLEGNGAAEPSALTTVTSRSALAIEGAGLHLTHTGTTMGTAAYMSPEQVRGEKLDARTDLFSLGLVLYEMVTGQKAFEGETREAIHEAILCREPTPVRELNSAVSSGLERIIRKATEKDRALRYGSAEEIGSDLERLRKETVSTGSWRSRNWIAAAVILAVLALGTTVLVKRFRPSARVEPVVQVKARRSLAVLGFRNLAKRPDQEWIATALSEMVGTELAAGQELRIISGDDVAHTKLDLALDAAGSYGTSTLKRIHENLGVDLIVQGSYLASSGGGLRIDWQLQETGEGGTIAAMSESGSEAQVAELVSRAGASLREKLGIATASPGELDKARAALPSDPRAAQLYSEALAKSRNFDPLDARDLLVKATQVDPKHALSHSLLAESLFALGYDTQARAEAKNAFDLSSTLPRENQLLIEGRYHELSNDFPAAIETYRSLWKFFPDNLDYGLRLAAAETKVSQTKDALLTITELRKLPEPLRNDLRIGLAESNVLSTLGDFKRSQQIAQGVAEKAKVQGNRLLLADARSREGWALDRLGDFDKALAASVEARNLAQQSGNLRVAAYAANTTGAALYDKGDLEGARKAYEDALGLARQVGAQRTISTTTANIGNTFYDQGRYTEARPYYEQALEINRRVDNKGGMASDLGNLANVLQGLGDLDRCLNAEEQALQAFRDVGDRRGEGVTIANLGSVLTDRGELIPAKQRFEEALTLVREIGFQRGEAPALLGIAAILEAQDHLPEARTNTLEALALSQKLKDDSDTALSQSQLADIALEQGNASEAEGLARSATEEFAREKSVANGCSSAAVLGRALLAQGKLKEAQSATDAAVALCQKAQVKSARFQASLASAAVTFKAGKAATALQMLDSLEPEIRQGGFGGYKLESLLLVGQIELNSGRPASGRVRLEGLEKDAQQKNFSLVARKAYLQLKGSSPTF